MAGPTLSYINLARLMKIVALLLFITPWVTVSCSPEALGQSAGAPMTGAPTTEIASASGYEMATGSVVFQGAPPSTAENAPPRPFSAPDPVLIGAAGMILLALFVTFVLKGAMGAGAAIGAVLAAGALLIYTVMVRVPKAVQDYFAAAGASDGPTGPAIDTAELAQMIQTRVEIGFWLTIAAMAVAVVMLLLSMPARTAAATAAEPPPIG